MKFCIINICTAHLTTQNKYELPTYKVLNGNLTVREYLKPIPKRALKRVQWGKEHKDNRY